MVGCKPLNSKQLFLLEHLFESGTPVSQILGNPRLRRSNGDHLKERMVKSWQKRFRETGSCVPKKSPGRKRILNINEERKLIKFVDKNSLKSYRTAKNDQGLSCSVRTVNRYAQRHGYSKCMCVSDCLDGQ